MINFSYKSMRKFGSNLPLKMGSRSISLLFSSLATAIFFRVSESCLSTYREYNTY